MYLDNLLLTLLSLLRQQHENLFQLQKIIIHFLNVKKDKAEECLEDIKKKQNNGQKGGLHITEKRKIKELRNLGLNGNQIAKEIGRDPSTIYSYCRKESSLN